MCLQGGWCAQTDTRRVAHLGLHVICHNEEHVGSCGKAQRVIVAPVHAKRAPCDVH